jgi:hypothetical protein
VHIQPRKPSRVHEKLRGMLENEKERRIIGEALRRRVEEYYSPKIVNAKLLEVYRQAI